MTQEHKELLLKDLCARLPYFTKVQIKNEIVVLDSICDDDGYYFNFIGDDREGVNIEKIKPYLFPLSSMTDEQKEELKEIVPTLTWSINIGNDSGDILIYEDTPMIYMCDLLNYINWCYKNHFDVNGLIPLDLAIDATDLNIY